MTIETATVGGGCFWCTEAAFKELEGVQSVTAGYAGGETADPTYREVCSGTTGHAEVVQIEYDSDRISYEALLSVFFAIHDPTQLNRQGPDVGSQYRSIILTHSEDQRRVAEAVIDEVSAQDHIAGEIVTEVESLEAFYPAESTHQDYYEKNPTDAYCTMHAEPKVQKVRDEFADEVV